MSVKRELTVYASWEQNSHCFSGIFLWVLSGLTDEDLTAYQVKCNNVRAVKLERYYSWTDGFEAALSKHGSIQKFQEIALKRCIRSQKLIHKNFPKAASSRRKRVFNKFQNENHAMKNVLTRCKEGADPYLRYHEPQKIGQDFIEGTCMLHTHINIVFTLHHCPNQKLLACQQQQQQFILLICGKLHNL